MCGQTAEESKPSKQLKLYNYPNQMEHFRKHLLSSSTTSFSSQELSSDTSHDNRQKTQNTGNPLQEHRRH